MDARQVLRTAFATRGPVDRKTYVAIGATLMVIKYAVDAAFIYAMTAARWTPIDYLGPLVRLTQSPPAGLTDLAALILLVWSLPFIWIGVVMSARRAADAGLPPWLAVAFLVPVLNWALILTLVLVPGAPAADRQRSAAVPPAAAIFDRQAVVAVLSGVACACAMVLVGVYTLQVYGLTLFLGAPFALGVVTGSLANLDRPRGNSRNAALVTVAVLLAGVSLIGFALEGAICIVMAVPIALPMAFIGGAIGEAMASRRRLWKGSIAMLLVLTPGGSLLDRARDHPATRVVLTAIEVDAPPAIVWRHVIAFQEITDPLEWFFKAGLAYPMRARIEGQGVGAMRYCEFSTGAFTEPITEWTEPTRLAFDVAGQPPPLQEWSPYSRVYAPHLAGYFRTTHGEFHLVPLSGNRTRLEGRTWYTLRMTPAAYWHPLADTILHRIHARVLRHVKRLSELSSG